MGVVFFLFVTKKSRNCKVGWDMSVTMTWNDFDRSRKCNDLADTIKEVASGKILTTMCKQLYYVISTVLQKNCLDASTKTYNSAFPAVSSGVSLPFRF